MSTPLDKFLLRHHQSSLKKLRLGILNGLATVNHKVVKELSYPVDPFSFVSFDGKVLQDKTAHYLMLHKPKNVVSATKDEQHKTVIDLIDESFSNQLHIAGRLDLMTSGLVLLTNDGAWSQALMLPEQKKPKRYWVKTEKPMTEQMVSEFKKGMFLSYENVEISPAELEIMGSHEGYLTIYEGKYHQIKRMFGRFQNKVIGLHRLSMAGIILDDNLQQGEYRTLTLEEIGSVVIGD